MANNSNHFNQNDAPNNGTEDIVDWRQLPVFNMGPIPPPPANPQPTVNLPNIGAPYAAAMYQPHLPRPNPFPEWSSQSGFIFQYTPQGELSDPLFSVEQIQEFIYNHPYDAGDALTLFIQRCPPLSNQYPTPHSADCRFANCLKGNTILPGEFRVAFDEKSVQWGLAYNPAVVAGYVHLGCLEWFCDLAQICMTPNIRVRCDFRLQYPREPLQTWWGALGFDEGYAALRYLYCIHEDKFFQMHPTYPRNFGVCLITPTLHIFSLEIAMGNALLSASPVTDRIRAKYTRMQRRLTTTQPYIWRTHLNIIDDSDSGSDEERAAVAELEVAAPEPMEIDLTNQASDSGNDADVESNAGAGTDNMDIVNREVDRMRIDFVLGRSGGDATHRSNAQADTEMEVDSGTGNGGLSTNPQRAASTISSGLSTSPTVIETPERYPSSRLSTPPPHGS